MPSKEKGEVAPSIFSAYVRVWALSTALRAFSRAGRELKFNEAVIASCILAFACPRRPVAVLLALATRIGALIASLPYIHDSQHWALQTDVALLVSLVPALLKRRSLSAILRPEESAPIAARAGATIYVQFVVFYAAAAYFKHNTAWMDPKVSCAPIYLVSLMEQHLPPSLLAPSIVEWVTAAAPTLVLLVEAIIPVLFLLDTRVAVAFTSLFHWMIAIVPPPVRMTPRTSGLTRVLLPCRAVTCRDDRRAGGGGGQGAGALIREPFRPPRPHPQHCRRHDPPSPERHRIVRVPDDPQAAAARGSRRLS